MIVMSYSFFLPSRKVLEHFIAEMAYQSKVAKWCSRFCISRR